ncbi:MAG: hydrogenase iron-sulfur subunit [Thermoguttaceae bacterium]|nr:hydrogenase iron-sulfur subunit [Thermoguttaceae bacterium]
MEDQSLVLEPKVVAFCCTYCAYTAADLAGAMRLEYPPNVRVVQILCTGKVEVQWLLRAFEQGADAVYVAGCALGDCHFLEGNLQALRTVGYAKRLLAEVGLEPERLEFFHIPASAGLQFAERARQMTERARQLGPNPLRINRGLLEERKIALPPDPHPPLPPAQLGRIIRDQQNG